MNSVLVLTVSKRPCVWWKRSSQSYVWVLALHYLTALIQALKLLRCHYRPDALLGIKNRKVTRTHEVPAIVELKSKST